MSRTDQPRAKPLLRIVVLASHLAVLVLTLACAPPFFPSQAPPDPVPALPVPNIDATVEAIVTQRVEEALAAIPTVTPAPTATPIPTPTPLSLLPDPPLPNAGAESLDSPVDTRAAARETAPDRVAAPAHPPAAPDLARMVDRVKPGVVRINTVGGVGSGIIIESPEGQKGLVLTNYHVVGDSFRIDVLVDDSRTFRGRVIGFDQGRDLAVVEICCDDFPNLSFSSAPEISPGSEVIAIGYALGLTGHATVTRGIVSAIRYHPGMKAWVIQTDASINPGNSGGPLLLPTGEVIGIATFIQNQDMQGNPTAGLGFAISERTIRELLPDLKEGARVAGSTPSIGPRPGPSPSVPPMDTYTSPAHRYTVDVPQGWTVDDSDADQVHFDSPDTFAGLTFIAYDKPVNDVDDWVDALIREHRDFYRGGFQLVDRETVEYADGSEGAHIVFRAQVSRRFCLLRVTEMFLRSGAGDFVASFHICEHSYARYLPHQQAALTSIRLP